MKIKKFLQLLGPTGKVKEVKQLGERWILGIFLWNLMGYGRT
jgi:hypothetical protein